VKTNFKRTITGLLVVLTGANIVTAQPSSWSGPQPQVSDDYLNITKKFRDFVVVLKPDKDEPEWWAGAPSVVREPDGKFWLACRMRSPEFPRGLRGYEIRILKSRDGIHFEKVKSIKREEVPIPGFERPALLIDPDTKMFKLYVCGPWQEGPWCILKLNDVTSLANVDPASARPVIQPPVKTYGRDVSVLEYKDPVITYVDGEYHCFVTGYIRRNERIFHFISEDGEHWMPTDDVNQPYMDLCDWHNFFVRPSSVLPLGFGYLFIYEGSNTRWYDPVYNIGIGLGFSFDLQEVRDLTPESPLVISTTPGNFHTFRYSDWLWVDGEIWVYAEVAKPNNANEIRLFRLSME